MVEKMSRRQLNLLKGSIRFEVEGTSDEFRDSKFLQVSKEKFLEEYYIAVENEDEIIDACFHTNELTCIVGPKGCGKTTTLIKILEKNCPDEFGYIRIDFSKELSLLRYLKKEDPTIFEDELRRRINQLLRNKFYDGENRQYLIGLCIELLKRPLAHYTYRNIYEDYIDEREDAELIYDRSGMNVSYDEWLQNEDEDMLIELIERVRKRLGIKQLIWGLLKFDRCKKFTVIFDNVDRVPNYFQPNYLSVANDIQNDIGTFSKCIVAIREENIRRPEGNTEQQADFIELVYFKGSKSYSIRRKREVRLPLIEDDFTNNVIQKRLELAKRMDLENNPEDSKEEIEKNWELMEQLTQLITKTYFREKLSKIANCSIRLVLDVFYDFLKYILLKNETEISTALNSSKRSRIFESYFYSWLIQNGGKLDLYLYNLVELYHRWEKSEKLGCFPEHVALTYLCNRKRAIEKTGRKYHYTTVGELHEEMSAIGFTSDEILKAILELYYVDPVFGQMIDMRNFKETYEINISNINKDDQIWILPRGEICCSDTTHKYTYFIENIYKHHCARVMINLIDISSSHIEEDVKFLCKIARMHLSGLVRIRNNTYQKYGDRWLEKYKEKFCIGGYLQLDRIIYNHYQYLRNFCKLDDIKILEELRRKYDEEVEKVNLTGRYDMNLCKTVLKDIKKRYNNILIVHGYNRKIKSELRDYLQNTLQLPRPVILTEKPYQYRTIIEKFEKYGRESDLVFVLLIDDVRRRANVDKEASKLKRMQNVIFELGYFHSKLERGGGKVVLLYKFELKLPSNIHGITCIDISKGILASDKKIRKELDL